MHPEAVFYATTTALCFLVYDIAITFDDEVECIWIKPNRSWVKWIFFATRYVSVSCLVTYKALQAILLKRPSSLPVPNWTGWLAAQILSAHVLLTLVEIVLMSRVYALYERDKRVLMIFGFIIVTEFICTFIGVGRTIAGGVVSIEALLLRTPKAFVNFGFPAIASQILIVVLTGWKYLEVRRTGWTGGPLVVLAVRDGSVAFVILMAMTVATTMSSLMDSKYAPLIYHWFLAIVASAGCRLIINMLRLPHIANLTSAPDDQIDLTTIRPSEFTTHHSIP